MLAVYANSINFDDPLNALAIGQLENQSPNDDWVEVKIKSASLNHHDLWSLKGVGLAVDRLPMILGCDGAGITADGREVILHSVINDPAWQGNETEDPKRSILSEKFPGTFAESVWVPARNLIEKPSEFSWEVAGSLSTAWLTAFSMLKKAEAGKDMRILIQGAGGGVSTALIQIASALGAQVWATSRSESKRERALSLGAHQTFASNERLPERVDVVMETVGAATWQHSVRSLRPGGKIIISGATSGDAPPAELTRIFFLQLSVIGSTMGSRHEFEELIQLMRQSGIRPEIDSTFDFSSAPAAFARMLSGEQMGKIVLKPGA